MLPTLARALPMQVVYAWGPGPWFLVFPLFWLIAISVVVLVVSRRRRAWGGRPWQGHPGSWAAGTRSARGVLAERFARGEIDEAEYRARLEVLVTTEQRQP